MNEVEPFGIVAPQQESLVHDKTRIRWLDGLRGLAALVVVLQHARSLFAGLGRELARDAPVLDAVVGFVARRNVEAVLLFFVLSGFSIRLTVEARGLRDAQALLGYYRRRAERILPLYWLALALSALVAFSVAPLPPIATSLRTLLGNLLFLQTASGVSGQWFLPYAGNGALWSLSFEVFFYAGYPWLVRAFPRLSSQARAVLGLSLFGYALCAVLPSPFALFCSASLTWYFGVELGERYLHGRSGLSLRAHVVLWAVLALLRASAWGVWFHGPWVASSFFLLGVLLLGARSLAATRWLGAGARALSALAPIGDLSYALYLLHLPVLRAFGATAGQSGASAALAVALSIVLAYFAERLARELVRRRADPLWSRRNAAASRDADAL